ncbi:MAG: baseplate J/gp47 family protein [Lachnospiraceae bacterium]|nr:baseplate J/gp47 family protein [Lachnospiraceae bacterium]
MEFPIMDKRTKEDIYRQIIMLAKSYVPEWSTEYADEDPGHILTKMFAKMFEETLQRYNKIPYKNLVYFLNLIGADILPCMSSKGFVTIKMNEGTDLGVEVQKGTAVYGQDEENQRVTFEIKDDLLAVDNYVKEIYSVSTKLNKIVKEYDYSDEELSSGFRLFDFYGSENLQKYAFFLCSDEVFFVEAGGTIVLTVVHSQKPYSQEKTAQLLADKELAAWEYLTEDGWKQIHNSKAVSNQIQLSIEEDIAFTECFEKTSRWIRCIILDPNKYEDISFTGFHASSVSCGISPDSLYYNDISLPKKDFVPFGEKFSAYDDFYINCNQAFTKRGAWVNLTFSFGELEEFAEDLIEERDIKWKHFIKEEEIKEPEKQDIYIQKVLWEYWNGNGWARLFEDNRYEDFFKNTEKQVKTLSFYCPKDMDTAFVGADYGMWIRARILSVNNAFNVGGRYKAPLVKEIFAEYSYKNDAVCVDGIFVQKDMEIAAFQGLDNLEIQMSGAGKEEYPSVYLSVAKAIKGGPIKLYFIKQGASLSKLPSLKWEYWGNVNGISKWNELKIQDETAFFQKSGIVTFLCKDNFRPKTLFGKESFWIRLVNIDKKYDSVKPKDREFLPKLKGIYFNTVAIEQKEKMNTEYFYLEKDEPNKKCHLNTPNVLALNVWVDEAETLIGEDRYSFKQGENSGVFTEEDEKGLLTEYWVPWQRVKDLAEFGAEDRVYVLDEENNFIQFGNGIHGKIPCARDKESIRAEYTVSVGAKGNFSPFQIEGFSDAVPFVDSVKNLEAICGGCNREKLDEAMERCFGILKHQNKVVSQEDFSVIAKQADRNIVDVKTAIGVNQNGQLARGTVVVGILPLVVNGADSYFDEIKKNVDAQFAIKAPAVLTVGNKIQIIEAQYIEYCVHIEASVKSYNHYQQVYKEIESKLEKFLNPITGNFDGKGFKMGALPNKMKLYNYIKNIDNMAEIQRIYIFCYEKNRDYRKEIDYDDIFSLPFAVPINGIHEIEISMI